MAKNPAKRTKKEEANQNPLASLPVDILDIAFSLLPLRDAIRSGLVATRFRSTWHFNKNFLFTKELALKNDQRALTTLVDRVFNSHQGDEITRFHLHVDPNGVEDLLTKWLGICSEKKTQELKLHFLKPGMLMNPVVFNGLTELRTLKLVQCELAAPPFTRDMEFLRTVILKQMALTAQQLELLIQSCRMLETLELYHCSELHRVRINGRDHRRLRTLKVSGCNDVETVYIDCPSLRSFWYSGFQATITFFGFEVLLLQEAIFNFQPNKHRGGYNDHREVENLVYVILNVTTLTISAHFLEALSTRIRGGAYRVYQGTGFRLLNLRELQLFMEATSYCNPLDILLFLKNCPNLESFFIDLNNFNFNGGAYWEVHQKPLLNKFTHYFKRLRIVKIKGFKFERAELALVKFLLQSSVILEQLILVTAKTGSKLHLPDAPKFNHLFHSWKASPHVKIVLYDHNGDKSGIAPTHTKYWR